MRNHPRCEECGCILSDDEDTFCEECLDQDDGDDEFENDEEYKN